MRNYNDRPTGWCICPIRLPDFDNCTINAFRRACAQYHCRVTPVAHPNLSPSRCAYSCEACPKGELPSAGPCRLGSREGVRVPVPAGSSPRVEPATTIASFVGRPRRPVPQRLLLLLLRLVVQRWLADRSASASSSLSPPSPSASTVGRPRRSVPQPLLLLLLWVAPRKPRPVLRRWLDPWQV